MRNFQNSKSDKSVKGGILSFFNILFVAKYQNKTEEGLLGILKSFRKKYHGATGKKKRKRGHFSRVVCCDKNRIDERRNTCTDMIRSCWSNRLVVSEKKSTTYTFCYLTKKKHFC